MKVKILKDFMDKHSGVVYFVGHVHEFTEERVNEIKENSKKFNFEYIEELEDKEVEVTEENKKKRGRKSNSEKVENEAVAD